MSILPTLEAADVKIKLNKPETKFKMAFVTKLANGYELKDMKLPHIKEFQRFLSETVYKGLSISEVDALYLRKKRNGRCTPCDSR